MPRIHTCIFANQYLNLHLVVSTTKIWSKTIVKGIYVILQLNGFANVCNGLVQALSLLADGWTHIVWPTAINNLLASCAILIWGCILFNTVSNKLCRISVQEIALNNPNHLSCAEVYIKCVLFTFLIRTRWASEYHRDHRHSIFGEARWSSCTHLAYIGNSGISDGACRVQGHMQ